MNRVRRRGLAAFLGASIFLGGCGYQNLARLPAAGPTGVRIALPALANRSAEPGVEAVLTAALSRELQRAGFAPVAARGPGDHLLAGAVTACVVELLYSRRSYRAGPLPNRLALTAAFTLAGPGEAPPESPGDVEFSETVYFYRDGPYLRPEPEALEMAGEALARRVVSWLRGAL